jgi:hypothetical protein
MHMYICTYIHIHIQLLNLTDDALKYFGTGIGELATK